MGASFHLNSIPQFIQTVDWRPIGLFRDDPQVFYWGHRVFGANRASQDGLFQPTSAFSWVGLWDRISGLWDFRFSRIRRTQPFNRSWNPIAQTERSRWFFPG